MSIELNVSNNNLEAFSFEYLLFSLLENSPQISSIVMDLSHNKIRYQPGEKFRTQTQSVTEEERNGILLQNLTLIFDHNHIESNYLLRLYSDIISPFNQIENLSLSFREQYNQSGSQFRIDDVHKFVQLL